MDKLKEKVEEQLKIIENNGINANNIEHLYKLIKIKHIMKEDEDMYRSYGRPGYDSYGDYGRRGYDAKYRGYGHLDRIGEHYGRYMDGYSGEGLMQMLECMEDFARTIKEEAKSPEDQRLIKETTQRIAQM